MASKVGKLIKTARTNADLTQARLAKKVGGGLTARDISEAERGKLDLSQTVLRKITKATGVTQASLVNAAKETGQSTSKPKKPKTPSNAMLSIRVTVTEKKLVSYYRLADSDTKKAAIQVLKGENTDLLSSLLGAATGSSGAGGDSVADMLGDALGNLLGGN